jgi:glutamate-1-semialdehyde 2,1-aminomutase
MSKRYTASEAILERALRVIPLGAQTVAKSINQFPRGASPFFAARARGGHVWDVDGNEYIDMINALASITLGHCDPDVTNAVEKQIGEGTIFSLSHILEAEVAELICDMVPCAEMVRFGKNGSDATAGAIRVARAYTGRDHVLFSGYHGWQDWYIGATSCNKGVPNDVRNLTHSFPYNDLPALERTLAEFEGKVAAVIMEPMHAVEPKPDYLKEVSTMAHEAGALFILDEMITGFRIDRGGAQSKFGITPDLATLGKGLANGYPLSAVVGKREIMREMEEVFFSLTMAGETLSLAAAKATLLKLKREPVLEALHDNGARLKTGTSERIKTHGLESCLTMSGDPAWSVMALSDTPTATSFELRTLFMQEVMKRGLLNFGIHFMSYAHTKSDVDKTLAIYDEVFPIMSDAMRNGTVLRYLECDVLKPQFTIR